MRKIGIKEIEDIALGAAVLGSGGGGDAYVGKLMAIDAIQDCGPITLLTADEIPSNAFIVPVGIMGVPTVLIEKALGGNEYKVLYDTISQFYDRKIFAFMPIEAGGMNSMFPFVAAARTGLPVIDADGMGRAFPELHMVTFNIAGIDATPMIIVDEKGNSIIFKTVTNKWAEKLARSITISCGGLVSAGFYCVDGKIVNEFGVKGIISRSEKLGREIRKIKENPGASEENFFSNSEAIYLFQGKITDVLREVRGAFNFGKVTLEGIDKYKGRKAQIEFQNENLIATVDEKIVATTPDLICMVDDENFVPVTTDAIKYGKRVILFGLKCCEIWRSPKGLELVGPRCFGYDIDYIPIETRAEKGGFDV